MTTTKQMTEEDWLLHYSTEGSFKAMFEDLERLDDRVLRGCYLSSSEQAQRRAIDTCVGNILTKY